MLNCCCLFVQIYVVDSMDRDRIRVAREEFQAIIKDPLMLNNVILVLANKQDQVPNNRPRSTLWEPIIWLEFRLENPPNGEHKSPLFMQSVFRVLPHGTVYLPTTTTVVKLFSPQQIRQYI
jgi:hypothetical protein